VTALADLSDPAFTDEQRARLARFEAAEDAPESLRDRVAVAIHGEQNRGAAWTLTAGYVKAEYRRLADAAIAAMEPGQ
jgi:hypothetical protein